MALSKQWLFEELRRYAIITVYLYVCLGAIILYRASLLHAHGIEYTFWGIALIKALILGKFLMIGEAAGVGEGHYKNKPRLYRVLFKSIALLLVLLFLSIVEESIRGIVHGEPLMQAIADFGGGTWGQIGALCLLVWLILLPYLLMVELSEALGASRLREIFLAPI